MNENDKHGLLLLSLVAAVAVVGIFVMVRGGNNSPISISLERCGDLAGQALGSTATTSISTRGCTDSDGGKTPDVKGSAKGILASGAPTTSTDRCSSSTRLLEFWCREGSKQPEGYYTDCPLGCLNGACRSTPPCIDSDKWQDRFTPGQVSCGTTISSDTCSGTAAVDEYYVDSSGNMLKTLMWCPNRDCVTTSDGYGSYCQTMLAPPPPPSSSKTLKPGETVGKCSDGDNGVNTFTKESLTTTYDTSFIRSRYGLTADVDACADANSVIEFYCSSSGQPNLIKFACTYGCVDGACKTRP